jgi:hypothetical protein
MTTDFRDKVSQLQLSALNSKAMLHAALDASGHARLHTSYTSLTVSVRLLLFFVKGTRSPFCTRISYIFPTRTRNIGPVSSSHIFGCSSTSILVSLAEIHGRMETPSQTEPNDTENILCCTFGVRFDSSGEIQRLQVSTSEFLLFKCLLHGEY